MKFKYFVGIYESYENYYRCFRAEYYTEPGIYKHQPGHVIWRGNDFKEGQEVVKKANADRKKGNL